MTRKIDRREIEGVRVFTTELDFMAATDLLPELGAIIGGSAGSVMKAHEGNFAAFGLALGQISERLLGGKLSALLPRLLAGTTVVVPDDSGQDIKVELRTPKDINRAFTGRKKLALGCLRVALEVNFADFLDGFAPVAPAAPALDP